MKGKILNFLLIVTSLIGYLEWGKDQHSFLFQVEAELISKMMDDPMSLIHPMTLLPLAGQIMLLITLFQKQTTKILLYAGIGGIGILLVLMFVIGLMSFNYKILASTIPFLTVAFLTVRYYRKVK